MPANDTVPGNKVEYLRLIETRLKSFRSGALNDNAVSLLSALGYRSDKTLGYELGTAAGLLELTNRKDFFSREKARPEEWLSVDLLFQLTDEEIRDNGRPALNFDSKKLDVNSATQIENYIFFALELIPKEGGYSRTALADITREINRMFPKPALILFKHGDTLTLSVINRRLHKRDAARDVLEKVTLIKDIRIANPHRAHVEILYDLAFSQLSAVHTITNFVELHEAWRKTLDISELNKRFYKDLANWYFWALEQVEFPSGGAAVSDEVNRATNVIRLITRLIFVWFLKERRLVPDELFRPDHLASVLKDLSPGSSTFYKAVLQNLFFATLNTPMNDAASPREFRQDTDTGKRFNDQYMVHNQYRHKKLFRDPDAALGMFASIPFLNGGLFECLDKREEVNGKLVETRVDGFSDTERKQPAVPNRLFFCEEHNCAEDGVDLNEVYGTHSKTYRVRGLIDTLNRYKFTIAENTPIEEEVALDPELLGKVFENLLASYNPETNATARKQTGSFYTPREIVNYMVDESLIAYLETRLVPSRDETQPESIVMRQGDAQSSFVGQQPFVPAEAGDGVHVETQEGVPFHARLLRLFAYTDEPHGFTDAEVERLIKAIDEVRILDPACGSGAFPMGILGKLVFILARLDPQNARWKQRQIERVREAMRSAERIEDDRFRESTLQDLEAQIGSIEEAFERNELDYGRKLYLIENCIYGVDIQPIAIQISKLRFFISLIIDQRIRPEAENLGIRPLPNLETKFIAANALRKLEKPAEAFLRNTAIDEKERDLKTVRERYFTARTTQTKEQSRREDERLREEIGALLEAEGNFPHETTAKLIAWNPYDQNASADFFDPEWMFGVLDGFNVVLGNPPYIDSEAMVNIGLQELREYIVRNYTATRGNWDIYIAFIERGFNLLSRPGGLMFITPDKWLSKPFGEEVRRMYLNNIKSILIAGRDVFESANVDSIITLFLKSYSETLQVYKAEKESIFLLNENRKDIIKPPYALDFLFSQNLPLLLKIESNSGKFSEFLVCENACATSDAYKLKPFILDHQNAGLRNGAYFKVVNTGTIGRFVSRWGMRPMTYLGDKYLYPTVPKADFQQAFKNSYYSKSAKPKIMIKGLTLLDACIDLAGEVIPGKSTLVIADSDPGKLKVASGLINSKLYFFYISEKYSASSYNKGITFTKDMINNVPIPRLDSTSYATQLGALVDEILAARSKDALTDTSQLEREIDRLVYRLYDLTPDEIAIVEAGARK
ncbi:MAG TPA: Eco57I restriction-modification methylase domain-containing protein [Pyrinomonadaceae bacterium]